jgi:GH15 family glucan-1,4-alpha-glucosidase
VQIVFGVDGERELTERELGHLRGAQDSRPVRVGNAASKQRQLDAPGEILDVALALGDELDLGDPFVAEFLCQLVQRAADDGEQADAGVWERRDGARRHTVSQAMCWVALDRGLRLGLGDERSRQAWTRRREEICEQTLRAAWSPALGAFSGELDADVLESAVLLLARTGFVDAGDPRMRQTVERLVARLGRGAGLLCRSERHDGEPAFVACSFWLACWYAQSGDPAAARSVFEAAAATANDLGLLAEMADPQTRLPMGNFPQTLSHVALIAAARAIGDAESAAL